MKEIILSITAIVATIAMMVVVGCIYNLISDYIKKHRKRKKAEQEKVIRQRIENAVNAVALDYERKAFLRECAFEMEKKAAVREAELRAFRICDKAFGFGGAERSGVRNNGLYLQFMLCYFDA